MCFHHIQLLRNSLAREIESIQNKEKKNEEKYIRKWKISIFHTRRINLDFQERGNLITHKLSRRRKNAFDINF